MPVAYAESEPIEDVFLASSIEADAQTRRRLMQVLGSIAIESDEAHMSPEQEAAEEASLVAVAEDYFSPDPEKAANAKARLRADLKTNVFEILCESGHISTAESEWQKDGFYQNGYSQRAMYAHGTFHTSHPVERRRRELELLTELRIEDGFSDSRFQTHYLVEESRAPEAHEMPAKIAEKQYNLKTRKAMLRLTAVDEFGNRTTFVAPVAGVNKNGQPRDAAGVQKIRESLGAELNNVDPTSGLEESFWVAKDKLPDGIVDLVKLYDEGFGGNSFFGAEGQEGNYDTVVGVSRQRERQAERDMDTKIDALALEIRGMLRGDDCEAALLIMAHHAKNFAAELCVQDDSYDASQFGQQAASHIESARYNALQGNWQASERALQLAKETAIVYMCGMRLEADQAGYGNESSKELSWHGGKIKKGTCVKCNRHTDVGVENWCKECIKC